MVEIVWSEFWIDFANWFWTLPLFGQILVGIGLAVLAVLIITGVYYLIKGICYLIYYIFKGIYLLIKGIIVGFYRICEWFYYEISGKEKPKKVESEVIKVQTVAVHPKGTAMVISKETKLPEPSEDPAFCPYCGVKFAKRMVDMMRTNGIGYCHFCGKGFKEGMVEIDS